MQLTDEAIILSSNKYGENSGIVCALTENNGIYKGLVRGITGKTQRGTYQPGNVVDLTWRARLSEHLGNFSAGLLSSGAVSIMDNPIKLAALSSLCATLEATLQERDPANTIYSHFRGFLSELGSNSASWEKTYVRLELELLSQLGYGLDLTECAATGSADDLIYVSPKSGRAVSRDAGLPYCDKLLKLPNFLISASCNDVAENNTGKESLQVNDGLVLCSYFLNKYYFVPNNIQQPQARMRFVGMIQQEFERENLKI